LSNVNFVVKITF